MLTVFCRHVSLHIHEAVSCVTTLSAFKKMLSSLPTSHSTPCCPHAPPTPSSVCTNVGYQSPSPPLRAFQTCSLLSQDFISPAPEEVRILKLVWSANPLLVLSPIAPPKTNTGGAPHLIPRMVTPNECLIRTLSEPEDACPDIWTILTQHHL